MKTKKWILWAIVFALILSLTACGTGLPPQTDTEAGLKATEETVPETTEETVPETTEETVPETTEETVPETTEETVPETTEETVPETTEETVPEKEDYPACVTEEILFQDLCPIDDASFLLRIVSIAPDGAASCALRLEMENRSEEFRSVSVEQISVDGVMDYAYMLQSLSAGEKVERDLWLLGIDADHQALPFSHIRVTFRVKGLGGRLLYLETVDIYPQGPENAIHRDWEPQPGDTVLADAGGLCLAMLGTDSKEHHSYTVDLYMDNRTDRPVVFMAEDVTVNGTKVDPSFSTLIAPDSCGYGLMSFAWGELYLNDIEAVERIDFLLVCYDYEDPSAPYLLEQSVTIYP